jgi:hypothetical protein
MVVNSCSNTFAEAYEAYKGIKTNARIFSLLTNPPLSVIIPEKDTERLRREGVHTA